MQGPADGSRLLWKIGRGSLASSHAGTRLPIAVLPARAPGAPPPPAPGPSRGAGGRLRPRTSFVSQSEKRRTPEGAPAVQSLQTELPTVGLPTSGEEGRSGPLPLSRIRLPCRFRLYDTRMLVICQVCHKDLRRYPVLLAIRGKEAYDGDNRKRGSPLARAERKPARF